MRKLAAAILGGVSVASAAVGAAEQTIVLKASVPRFCRVSTIPAFSGQLNVVGNPGIGSSTATVTSPSTPSAVMHDFAFRFSARAVCNGASQFHLTSLNNGLKQHAAPSIPGENFLDVVNYTASGRWNNGPATWLTTTGSVGPVDSLHAVETGPAASEVVVEVTAILDTSAPVLAGNYADTLRITLTPQ